MEQEAFSNEELPYWLAFDRIQGAGIASAKVQRLREKFGNLSAAWQADYSELESVGKFIGLTEENISLFLEKRAEVDPEDLPGQLKALNINAYPLAHELYPFRLRHIYNPPLILYHKGRLSIEETFKSVAVVGSRHPTSYGQKLAKEFAFGLAAAGVTIISGMAYGIDSLAHRAAFEAKGKTIAVFGCGVDVCYPPSNRQLYKALTEDDHACCLSEFFPGSTPEPWCFPARNRIIAGISEGCLVIEAGDKSGSLITSRLAFEEGHPVFAIPGRIDSPLSVGTNRMIAQTQAQLVTSYEEVLTHLKWASGSKSQEAPNVVELYGREMEVYKLICAEPLHFDALCQHTGMEAGELSAVLTMLELAGVVKRLDGDWYSRI